jgi:hypothetical protein
MNAKPLVIQVHAGVEPLWCDDCQRSTRLRIYAFTEQSVAQVGTACWACRLDKRREHRDGQD